MEHLLIANNEKFVEEYELGGGAVFGIHIPEDEQAAALLKFWRIKIEHEDGTWQDEISSVQPKRNLKAPDLCGIFHLTVEVIGPDNKLKKIPAFSQSRPEIGCSAYCLSKIGIEVLPGNEFRYWTHWNVCCSND